MKLLIVSSFILLFACLGTAQKTACYFSSWAVYRQGNGKFDVDNIDPFLCTDLVFGFAGVDPFTYEIKVLDPNNELCPTDIPYGQNCAYDRFTALKGINPGLTTTLSVGGWNEDAAVYSAMAADPAKRQAFISSTVQLLNQHGFDGLDLDWEYPTQRGGAPEDRANYVTLLGELRSAFDGNSPRLQLTVAVGAGKAIIDEAYDVPGIVNFVDYLHVMTYDFHGVWETITDHQTPLCGYINDPPEYQYDRIDFVIDYYIELGAPPEKILAGIGAYGRGWTLADINDNGVLATAWVGSPAGPYTQQPGTLNNNEICEKRMAMSCNTVNDPGLNEPYILCEDGSWVGYEDEASAYKKARYFKNRNLAGAVVWTIDSDDFIPLCAGVSFPVVREIAQGLSEAPDADPFRCP